MEKKSKIYTDADGSRFEVILRELNHEDIQSPEYKKEILPAGSIHAPGAPPIICDILFEKNIPVKMRDGITLYTNILRPVTDEKVPGIIAWSPYGKDSSGPPVENINPSGLQKFEGPDPAFWVNHGYAVFNPDTRGIGFSGGSFCQWSDQMTEDGHDFVEWASGLDWCSGKVAFAGTSYLAISQWFIAASQPKGLAAIAPWEGFSDVYHHSLCAGGIPDYEFEKAVFNLMFRGLGAGEDMGTMTMLHPLFSGYWAEKKADLKKINIPAYVVASYTNKVHTRGTFDSYAGISSKEKWLRIHNTHEWYDFYHNQDDLLRFFDYFLKGKDNGWQDTPRVRMAVLNPGGDDIPEIAANSFPPENVRYLRYYLDGESKSARIKPLERESSVSYCSDDGNGQACFTLKFDANTTILGKIRLHLWAESPEGNDMDLFIMAQKTDEEGNELPVLVAGAPYCPPGGKAPFEWGNGRLRASLRNSDTKPQYLAKGEIIPVDIDLCTMGMIFEKDQVLKIIVCGYNPAKPELPEQPPLKTNNRGMHIIHTGLQYDSYLELPVLV